MKKKTIILAAILTAAVALPSGINAQEANTSSNLSIGADLVSRYIWRGMNLGGSSPHMQPFIEYTIGNSGLSIGAWGSYSLGFGTAGTEADLYLSWSPLAALSITLSDYFFPTDSPFERNNYFNYKKGETGHTFEAMITLGGIEKFPLYATFAMNIYGADGVDEMGENYNAKYIELGYAKSFENFDAAFFLGMAPDNPGTDQGGIGWYGDKAGIINLGLSLSKTAKINDFSLPVSASLIFNPEAGNYYLVMGISL